MAAGAPCSDARSTGTTNVILWGLEIYLLITGVVIFGIGVVGTAMGSAANGVAVAIGLVLLACWATTMRMRRRREQR